MKRRLMLACALAAVATSVAVPSAQAASFPPQIVGEKQQQLPASPPAPAPSQRVSQKRLLGFSFWKVFDCVLAVSGFVVGNSILVLRVKKAGGVLKFAKRLWKSRTTEQRLKVVASVIGYVAGTGAMVRACTPNDD
jgi:hypothetical protein